MNIRKIIKRALIAVISIGGGAVVLFLLMWYVLPYIHEDLESSVSPDEKYKIEVEFSSEGSWPFGDHTIHIYKKNCGGWRRKKITTSSISNDGARPSTNNCLIEWKGSMAVIKLNGDEQDEEIILVDCLAEERVPTANED